MSAKPGTLYWVDMKLSGKPIPYRLNTAGVRGGKRSSLKACQDARATILRADPQAKVRIFRADVEWVEVDA